VLFGEAVLLAVVAGVVALGGFEVFVAAVAGDVLEPGAEGLQSGGRHGFEFAGDLEGAVEVVHIGQANDLGADRLGEEVVVAFQPSRRRRGACGRRRRSPSCRSRRRLCGRTRA
jgi:hypothetical protein